MTGELRSKQIDHEPHGTAPTPTRPREAGEENFSARDAGAGAEG